MTNATDKQRWMMHKLGIMFSNDITKEAAHNLISAKMDNQAPGANPSHSSASVPDRSMGMRVGCAVNNAVELACANKLIYEDVFQAIARAARHLMQIMKELEK